MSEIFEDIFGCSLSSGTLYNANLKCYETLEETENRIKQKLISAKVACFDETGMRINKTSKWIHVACTEKLTFYFSHDKRGSIATKEMGILPNFKGVAMHDFYSSYYNKFACKHALCNAHLLRDLIFILETIEKDWAQSMIDLLVEIKRAVDDRKSKNELMLTPVELSSFKERYDQIVKRAIAEIPPPAIIDNPNQPKKRGRIKKTKEMNLLDRLDAHWNEILAFMYDFDIPFDNNQAERDLRMMKVRQKVSGCFRSDKGAGILCRIRGYISTSKKNSMSVIEGISSVYDGNPFLPKCLTS